MCEGQLSSVAEEVAQSWLRRDGSDRGAGTQSRQSPSGGRTAIRRQEFPNVPMAGRDPPHMGPVAHGVAVLGDAAQCAVSQLAALAADAVQAPSRLSQAAALLTDDGRVGTVWRVTALFGGLLLGAIGV